MAEDIPDKLALRIEARRKAARLETEAGPAPAPPVEAATNSTVARDKEQFLSETEPKSKEPIPEIAEAINAIASGANPLVVARLLSAVLATGMKRRELINQIGKSEGWLSKRLGLLNAPKDIQRLIEAGQLSESEYHDNRQNVKAGMRGRGESLQYQRMPTVTINIEAARALTEILKDLAEQQGAAPIRFDANTSKKDITSILNLRAGELRGMKK
jgi:DNA-binding HxlR family transcriptional regulator